MKKLMSVVLILWAGVMLQAQQLTVLGNYAPVLPLTANEVAVVSIGKEGADKPFTTALSEYASITPFQLTGNSDENEYQRITNSLANFKRVIVSVTGETVDVRVHRKFLNSLNPAAPLVYVVFSSGSMLNLLEEPFEKAAAVVVTYQLTDKLQKEAAAVVFGKADASGKLPEAIGYVFKKGDGVELKAGKASEGLVPEDYGMKSYILNQKIDNLISRSLQDTVFPGGQLLIVKDGVKVYDKCFGTRSDSDLTSVRPTDVYDLGELTQTTATLLAIMKLYDSGMLQLDDKISASLPALRNTNKKDVTIRELLYHESGVIPYLRFYLQVVDDNTVEGPFFQGFIDKWHYTRAGRLAYACSDFKFKQGYISDQPSRAYSLQMADNMWVRSDFKNMALQTIARTEMNEKKYVHNSIGFILLHYVVEAVAGMPMNEYLDKEFYQPMGLNRTLFLPLQRLTKDEIIPTACNEYLRRQDIHGYVFDEAAACLGGVSGHAGLFSNTAEIAEIYAMLLNKGEYKGKRYLKDATCEMFMNSRSPNSHRGLGFDRPNIYNVNNWLANNCGVSTPPEVFGHTGSTGTCVWADPVNNIIYVFLSNQICPNAWNDKVVQQRVREEIQDIIYSSIK